MNYDLSQITSQGHEILKTKKESLGIWYYFPNQHQMLRIAQEATSLPSWEKINKPTCAAISVDGRNTGSNSNPVTLLEERSYLGIRPLVSAQRQVGSQERRTPRREEKPSTTPRSKMQTNKADGYHEFMPLGLSSHLDLSCPSPSSLL